MSDRYTVLIGGVPGVGKSSLSGEIAKEFGFNILLSGDYLREFYRAYVPADHPINTSVYEAWHMYGSKNEENVLSGFLAQSESMALGLQSVVRRAHGNGEYVVLETLYFVPSLYEEMMNMTIPLYLYIDGEEDHRKNLNSRIKYTHFKSPGERLSDRLWEYRIMMHYSLRECKSHEIPAFETSNYLDAKEKVLEYVGRSVRVNE